jgi:hypothetical protein
MSAGPGYLTKSAGGLQLMALASGGKFARSAYRTSRSAAYTGITTAASLLRRAK